MSQSRVDLQVPAEIIDHIRLAAQQDKPSLELPIIDAIGSCIAELLTSVHTNGPHECESIFYAASDDIGRVLLDLLVVVMRASSSTMSPDVDDKARSWHKQLRSVLMKELARAVIGQDPTSLDLQREAVLVRALMSSQSLRVYSLLLSEMEASLTCCRTFKTEVAARALLVEVSEMLHMCAASVYIDASGPELPEILIQEFNKSGVLEHWASCWLELASNASNHTDLLSSFAEGACMMTTFVADVLVEKGDWTMESVFWFMSSGGPRLQYLLLRYTVQLLSELDGKEKDDDACPGPRVLLYNLSEAVRNTESQGAITDTCLTRWFLGIMRIWYDHMRAVTRAELQATAAEEEPETTGGGRNRPCIFRFKDAARGMQMNIHTVYKKPYNDIDNDGVHESDALTAALYRNVAVLHLPRHIFIKLALRLVRASRRLAGPEQQSAAGPEQQSAAGPEQQSAAGPEQPAEQRVMRLERRIEVISQALGSCRSAMRDIWCSASPLPRRATARLAEWWQHVLELQGLGAAMDHLYAPAFHGLPACATPDVAAALDAGLLQACARNAQVLEFEIPKSLKSKRVFRGAAMAQVLAFGRPDVLADMLHAVAQWMAAGAMPMTDLPSMLLTGNMVTQLTSPFAIAWLSPEKSIMDITGARIWTDSMFETSSPTPPPPPSEKTRRQYGSTLAMVLVGVLPKMSAAVKNLMPMLIPGGALERALALTHEDAQRCFRLSAMLMVGHALQWSNLAIAAELHWRKTNGATKALGPWGRLLLSEVGVLEVLGAGVLLVHTDATGESVFLRDAVKACMWALVAAWPQMMQTLVIGRWRGRLVAEGARAALKLDQLRVLLERGGRLEDVTLLNLLEVLVGFRVLNEIFEEVPEITSPSTSLETDTLQQTAAEHVKDIVHAAAWLGGEAEAREMLAAAAARRRAAV